jgi:hypothetical protein
MAMRRVTTCMLRTERLEYRSSVRGTGTVLFSPCRIQTRSWCHPVPYTVGTGTYRQRLNPAVHLRLEARLLVLTQSKTCPSATFSTTDLTETQPGSSPGFLSAEILKFI